MNVSVYPIHVETLQAFTEEWATAGMHIELEISDQLQVLADRELLSRITANLLRNSQKYAGAEVPQVCIRQKPQTKWHRLLFPIMASAFQQSSSPSSLIYSSGGTPLVPRQATAADSALPL